jgi:hypothetical protein
MSWKNPKHLVSTTEFYGTPGQRSLNPIKPGLHKKTRMGSITISFRTKSTPTEDIQSNHWRVLCTSNQELQVVQNTPSQDENGAILQ